MNSVDPIHSLLPINYRPQPKKIQKEGEGAQHHHPQNNDSVELSNRTEGEGAEKTPEESLALINPCAEEIHHLDIAA